MNIYLVRVSRHEENGNFYIERKSPATTNDSYIAISHVWGKPATIQNTHVEGVEWDVPLSPAKRDILNLLRREDVCGDGWFWMDLFCIDQRPNATISIADQLISIPTIYRSSRCVKILIESPLCKEWHTTATQLLENLNPKDEAAVQTLGLGEVEHALQCPHMMIFDPWFERLWTRQEGLYGFKLEVVALNYIPCAQKPQSPPQNPISAVDKFSSLKSIIAKRSSTEVFLRDKYDYHEISNEVTGPMFFGSKNRLSSWYLDLIYRHKIIVADYDGKAGPPAHYSPVANAWRSARITTNARDYILAIFPDMPDYRVPANARRMSFDALFNDALRQYGHTAYMVTFPKGMLDSTISAMDSLFPWIPQGPSSCMEAFGGIFGFGSARPEAEISPVLSNVTLESIEWKRETIPELVQCFKSTANLMNHYGAIYFYHPWFGAHSNQKLSAEEEMLKVYIAEHFFSNSNAQILTPEQFSQMALKDAIEASGLHLRRPNTLVETDLAFMKQLRRFLAALICNTALATVDIILESAEFVFIHTPLGKLLALVNAEVANDTRAVVSLMTDKDSPYWGLQGLLLGTQQDEAGPFHLIGKTLIPKEDFWSPKDQPGTTKAGSAERVEELDLLPPVQEGGAASTVRDGPTQREGDRREGGGLSAFRKRLKSALNTCLCRGITADDLT